MPASPRILQIDIAPVSKRLFDVGSPSRQLPLDTRAAANGIQMSDDAGRSAGETASVTRMVTERFAASAALLNFDMRGPLGQPKPTKSTGYRFARRHLSRQEKSRASPGSVLVWELC